MTTDSKIKTGTTCIGLLFKDGVLLAADRRVTSYKIDSEKFTKLFDLTKSIVSTVSGGAADAQLFMRVIQGELKLLELKNERPAKVSEAAMMLNSMQYGALRSQGTVVGLIVGGYDDQDGVSLYHITFIRNHSSIKR
jgi:20S proteasome alpha/beta subunit